MTRKLAFPSACALIVLGALLLAAQPGLALPRAVSSVLFGPAMLRADAVVRTQGATRLYRLERGRIVSVTRASIVLHERDATEVKVPLAASAVVAGLPGRQGKTSPLTALRRGMTVAVVREGDGPAERVHVLQPASPLPPRLAAAYFGPKMARADVAVQFGATTSLYRLDRGQIRSIGVDSIVLRERDGTLVTVPVAEDAILTGVGRGRARQGVLTALRRNMLVETLREGDEPAERVHVPGR